jgi:LmbE family N-acetylglucosaminyl deacetylase
MADLRERILEGRVIVLAPHMDDEALACGGTVLLHRDRLSVHFFFATDGAASPAPLLPWLGRTDPGLPLKRQEEARATAGRLGVPVGNLKFLQLPDGRLAKHRQALESALADTMEAVRPDFVFAPFRYDVHPDHVALNRAIRAVLSSMPRPPGLLEYFVYHRLRGVPGGDVRGALNMGALLQVDIGRVSAAKRSALECYASQVKVQYPWQDRPILTEDSLRQRCAEPEYFLVTDPAAALNAGFSAHAHRVRLATLAMRVGKRPKDRAVAFLRWAVGR